MIHPITQSLIQQASHPVTNIHSFIKSLIQSVNQPSLQPQSPSAIQSVTQSLSHLYNQSALGSQTSLVIHSTTPSHASSEPVSHVYSQPVSQPPRTRNAVHSKTRPAIIIDQCPLSFPPHAPLPSFTLPATFL